MPQPLQRLKSNGIKSQLTVKVFFDSKQLFGNAINDDFKVGFGKLKFTKKFALPIKIESVKVIN